MFLASLPVFHPRYRGECDHLHAPGACSEPPPCNKGPEGICPEARQGCTYDLFNSGGRLAGVYVVGMTNNFLRTDLESRISMDFLNPKILT